MRGTVPLLFPIPREAAHVAAAGSGQEASEAGHGLVVPLDVPIVPRRGEDQRPARNAQRLLQGRRRAKIKVLVIDRMRHETEIAKPQPQGAGNAIGIGDDAGVGLVVGQGQQSPPGGILERQVPHRAVLEGEARPAGGQKHGQNGVVGRADEHIVLAEEGRGNAGVVAVVDDAVDVAGLQGAPLGRKAFLESRGQPPARREADGVVGRIGPQARARSRFNARRRRVRGGQRISRTHSGRWYSSAT